MDNFDRATVQRLASYVDGPCVTLHLATSPVGTEGEQDEIRLKNLLRDATQKLSGHWMRSPKARDLLERAANLPADFAFWKARSEGL